MAKDQTLTGKKLPEGTKKSMQQLARGDQGANTLAEHQANQPADSNKPSTKKPDEKQQEEQPPRQRISIKA